jgi:UDP-2,4-diacetamido-2,4,6-trideoxy-beta-L-altropyranose hydrolase
MRIAFRCDANASTGLGHLSRGLALAEALRELGSEAFFWGRYSPSAVCRIKQAGFKCGVTRQVTGSAGDMRTTVRVLGASGVRAVVVDSYEVDAEFVGGIEAAGLPVILIDDFCRLKSYPCSGVVNFTVNAPRLPYPRDIPLRLLGPRYFLARRKLRRLRRRMEATPKDGNHLLVAIGGTDRHDMSPLVARALRPLAQAVTLRVVIARHYRRGAALGRMVREFKRGSRLLCELPDLAQAFGWADICISGGGLTKYEAAYLGVPVGVISQTRAEAEETRLFAAWGLAVDFGLAETINEHGLTGKVLDWLADHRARHEQQRCGWKTFPADPTEACAKAVVRVIERL